jgi:hypothetical protein
MKKARRGSLGKAVCLLAASRQRRTITCKDLDPSRRRGGTKQRRTKLQDDEKHDKGEQNGRQKQSGRRHPHDHDPI